MKEIPSVELINIVKRFPKAIANDHVNFVCYPKLIHSVVGENGAGKTTLMNILYGMLQPDNGAIKIKGKEKKINSPADAINCGINMVHQYMLQMPDLTILENIIMGQIPRDGIIIGKKKAEDEINKIIESHNFNLKLEKKIRELSIGQMQQVEILKCLYKGGDILIFDEPTSVLTSMETKRLFNILRSLANKGYTIIFISHKLNEVFQISDYISVMRTGKLLGTMKKEDTTPNEIVRLMIGRSMSSRIVKKEAPPGNVILRIDKLSVKGLHNTLPIKNLSLEVREREIIGIAGVEGNGQKELVDALIGLRKVHKGKIYVDNICINNFDNAQRRKMGIAFIPDDRINIGSNMDSSVVENLCALKLVLSSQLQNGLIINSKKVAEVGWGLVQSYNIKVKDIYEPINNLSGGNIQKVLLARELSANPKLLIAYQATYGLDIAATNYVRKQIIKARETGFGTLLISADLDEILMLSDKILVISTGQIVGSFSSEEVTEDMIAPFMLGLKRQF